MGCHFSPLLHCKRNIFAFLSRFKAVYFVRSEKKVLYSKMVWYFIGVSKINRTLHDRCTHSWNIFQLSNRNLSLRRHITSTIYSPLILDDQSVGQFNYWQWSVGNLILFPTLSSNSQFTWNFRTLTTYCVQKPFSLSASTSDEDVGAWKYKYLK